LPPGPRVLYVRGTRTSHGRTVRTAYCGTPGNTWAHCVNTRLVLQHASGGGGGLRGAARQTQLRVAKDPMCAEALFNYYIGSAGFMDLPVEYVEY